MRIWILLACGLLTTAGACAASADGRFSDRLSDSERHACGLDLLSGDQVASLNALVRRDAVALAGSASAAPAKPFSQRLYPDEFRSAGLDRLTTVQLTQLDVLVGANLNHPQATASLAGAPAATAALAAPLASAPVPPDIHGMVSLTYGGGGGTTLREATTALDYVDPSHHLEISGSYSEVEVGGKSPYARAIPPP